MKLVAATRRCVAGDRADARRYTVWQMVRLQEYVFNSDDSPLSRICWNEKVHRSMKCGSGGWQCMHRWITTAMMCRKSAPVRDVQIPGSACCINGHETDLIMYSTTSMLNTQESTIHVCVSIIDDEITGLRCSSVHRGGVTFECRWAKNARHPVECLPVESVTRHRCQELWWTWTRRRVWGPR